MRQWVLVVGLSIGFLSACGEEAPPTPQELENAANEVVAGYRDRVVAQQAVYLEIARAAAAVPAVNPPPLDAGSGPKLPSRSGKGGRLDIDLKFLLDPTIDPFRDPDFLCLGGVAWYQSPLFWLEGKWGRLFDDRTPETVAAFMTERFDEFLGGRWIFVFRAHDFKDPVMLGKDAEPKDYFGRKIVGSFVAGSIQGDVLVFEVATRKFLGGVPFSGENSAHIDMAKFKTDPDYLRTDLMRNVRYNLEQAFKPYLAPR